MKTCKQCGTSQNDGNLFCEQCGVRFPAPTSAEGDRLWEAAISSPEQTSAVPAVQPPAVPPAEPVQPAAPAAVAPVQAMPAPEAQTVTPALAAAPEPAEPTRPAPKPAEMVRCGGCGAEVPSGDTCPLCGARLSQKKEVAPAAEAMVPAAPEPPPADLAPTAQKAEEVGKWLAKVTAAGLAALSKVLARAAEKKPAQPKPTVAPKPEPKTRQANGGAKKRPSIGRILLIVAVVLAFGYVLRDFFGGSFWRKLGVVSNPVSNQTPATVVTGSQTPAATATPTRTATLKATPAGTKVVVLVPETENVSEVAAVFRTQRIVRTYFLVIGVLAMVASVLLYFAWKKPRLSKALFALAVLALIVAGSAHLLIYVSRPTAPTATPTLTSDEEAARKTLTAEAPTVTPTLIEEKRVGTAVAVTKTAVAAYTATPTPTHTPIEKAADTATPTKVSEKATPTATTVPPTPTKPAPPKPEVVTKVTIEGFDGNLPGCLTLVFFQGNREVKRLQVVSPSVTWSGSADRVKIEGSTDGKCPWSTHTVDQSDKPVLGGEVKFTFAPVFDRGRP